MIEMTMRRLGPRGSRKLAKHRRLYIENAKTFREDEKCHLKDFTTLLSQFFPMAVIPIIHIYCRT